MPVTAGGNPGLPCWTLGVVRLLIEMVASLSALCECVRWQVGHAAAVSVWQNVNWSTREREREREREMGGGRMGGDPRERVGEGGGRRRGGEERERETETERKTETETERGVGGRGGKREREGGGRETLYGALTSSNPVTNNCR